ncbi:DNRLRE domain-containing protein [Candidatus Roizmanbacteria bacterium]|nr:DNRLRE domain-containing protein [Candidatus Roizmanbacteria bacterium]
MRIIGKILGAIFFLFFLFLNPISLNAETITLNPTDDTYIDKGSPSETFSSDTLLKSAWYRNGRLIQILIKFNVSIPQGSRINSAKLRLFQLNFNSPVSRPVMSIDTAYLDWNEAQASWNSFHGSSIIVIQGRDLAINPASSAYQEWDVADFVKSWVDRTRRNYGLVLSPDPNTDTWGVSFYSKERSSYKPELVVDYTPPTPINFNINRNLINLFDTQEEQNQPSGQGGAASLPQSESGSQTPQQDQTQTNQSPQEQANATSEVSQNVTPPSSQIGAGNNNYQTTTNEQELTMSPSPSIPVQQNSPDAGSTPQKKSRFLGFTYEKNMLIAIGMVLAILASVFSGVWFLNKWARND